MPILKRNGKTFSGTPTKVDTAKSYTTFDSADDKNPTTWSDVELLTSKEEQRSLFSKISTMFKNIRYLYKILGTTDISHYSDGTVTGAIKAACDKSDANETAIADVNSKLGNTDISAIGDGTLTGGLDTLNSNLGLINKKTFLWETSSNQGSKQIDFSPFSYVLIMISISTYATQCMIVPTYLKSLSALGIQTQVGIYSQNEYVYANMTYDGTTFSFSSNKNVLLDVIGIQ